MPKFIVSLPVAATRDCIVEADSLEEVKKFLELDLIDWNAHDLEEIDSDSPVITIGHPTLVPDYNANENEDDE